MSALRRLALVPVLGLATLGAAGCGAEATKDASKSGQTVDRTPATVIAMPDKFRNVATKCDGHGHRIYSSSTGDSGNAAQVFVIADAKCGH
jgi:hypothetical protein